MRQLHTHTHRRTHTHTLMHTDVYAHTVVVVVYLIDISLIVPTFYYHFISSAQRAYMLDQLYTILFSIKQVDFLFFQFTEVSSGMLNDFVSQP